jgi:hypothetical protein
MGSEVVLAFPLGRETNTYYPISVVKLNDNTAKQLER